MTGYYKVIGAFLGFVLFKYSFGMAFLGFLIGSFVDAYPILKKQIGTMQGGANPSNFGRGNTQYNNPRDIFEFYQRQSTRYDFPTMLLALSAEVMKADGKVLKAELNYVKTFLARQFGNQFSINHLQTLKQFLNAQNIPTEEICRDINTRMQPAVRTQLLHYLFGIAQADGNVSTTEMNVINKISNLLGISLSDYDSVKNMFHKNTESDYKILGIEKSTTDEEVKKAYRKMAVKFHPDKVAQMGVEYQTGAKEKFQKVQDAYEAIKKERGMN